MFSQNQKMLLILLIIALISGSLICLFKSHSKNDTYSNIMIEETNKAPEANNDFMLIHLSGEVKNPGVYKIKENSRLVDLLKLAGGVTSKADIDIINLVQPLTDGQKISIPKRELNIISNTTKKILTGQARININFADIEKLKDLPGIGEKLAERIITFREKNGLFKTINDLKKVPGIGDKLFNKIKENIIL